MVVGSFLEVCRKSRKMHGGNKEEYGRNSRTQGKKCRNVCAGGAPRQKMKGKEGNLRAEGACRGKGSQNKQEFQVGPFYPPNLVPMPNVLQNWCLIFFCGSKFQVSV